MISMQAGMPSGVEQTPFLRQLAASDRPTREKALDSLQTYLTCNRPFTEIELLKIWKGLFFCIFHTDRPLPQKHLSNRLATFLLPLSSPLFINFLHAFYTILTSHYSQIPSLRLDKYLYLIRRYVSSAFTYLSLHAWSPSLITSYLDLMQGPVGPLSRGVGEGAKVPDGLRYHMLDIWVEELRLILKDGEEDVGELLMTPIKTLEREGKIKTVRKRAKEARDEWESRKSNPSSETDEKEHDHSDAIEKSHVVEESETEWNGFTD